MHGAGGKPALVLAGPAAPDLLGRVEPSLVRAVPAGLTVHIARVVVPRALNDDFGQRLMDAAIRLGGQSGA